MQRDVPVERKVEVALQVNDCRGASARADRREAARETRAADKIGDAIELSACELLRSCERIGVAVVDRRGGAQSKQELVVSSACQSDRLSAGRRDQLDCEDAYAAAGAVNQHAFAGLDREAAVDHRVRRTTRERNCGRLDVREIRRLAGDGLGVGQMKLGVGAVSTRAEGGSSEHLVAGVPLADVRSDGVDDPGEVGADDRRQTQIRPGAVGTVGGIDRVDSRCTDSDANLAWARNRVPEPPSAPARPGRQSG